MTAYRVRNAIIHAIQWTGENKTELNEFTNGRFYLIDEEDRANADDPEATGALLESVHNTWVGLLPGEWVIRGGTGLFFKFGNLEFEDTYEVADA